MKPIHNYILLVDTHRRPSRCRNTWGRYRVGAKTPKEARRMLQQAIGFGSVHVYYESKENLVGYKELRKETWNGSGFTLEPVRHATAPLPKEK